MNTHDIRTLGADELRAANDLFVSALLGRPVPAADWDRVVDLYRPDRTLGAHLDGELAGTTTSFAAGVVVPGGAELPTAAVTGVGVRADRTRRGVLSALMRRQLTERAAAGDVLASLRATEARIYGRFGYGVATRTRRVRVVRRGGSGWRAGAPLGGDVRLLDRAEVMAALTALYPRIGLSRPGGMTRSESWWRHGLGRLVDGDDFLLAAVHTGPDGDDGFLVATVDDSAGWQERVLVVRELQAVDPAAVAGLWRFALGVDLAVAVSAHQRPLDEPLELLLADPRDCATTGVDDETWLRILDVPAALAARRFAPADPVLLAVRDPLLPANEGVYRIAGGAERVGDLGGRAALSCDVAGLAMAYLGDRRGRAGLPDRRRAVRRDELLTGPRGSLSVRELATDELRPAHRLIGAALLNGPADDRWWSRAVELYEPGRAFGAFLDGRLAGSTASFATRTAVPGGAALPTAAVMRVGVRADATRRGVLTALMGRQLAGCAAAGDVLASLRASEGRIYGRFGFGVATRFRGLRVRAGAGVRHGVPGQGRVRLLERAAVLAELSALHRRIGLGRPGGMERSPAWWRLNRGSAIDAGAPVLAAVHTGPAGDDGFLLAEAVAPDELLVGDLHAADPAAVAALWRFVLDTTAARTVTGRRRPVDEPVELLLADPRDCATTGVDDEAWLRILDVPAALAGRRFAPADPVLLAVHDPLLAANSGTYRIADGTAARVGGPARLSCDVAGLAMAYLGDRAPSELVSTGWWRAGPGADLDAADTAFAVERPPWCGTYF